jgi:hypothetical protein
MIKTASFFRTTFAMLLGMLLTTALAFFSTQSFVAAESGQAFSISPPLVELQADPGKTVNATIKLTNVSSGSLTMTVQANNFGSKNETGEPNILFDDVATPYTLKGWVGLPGGFELASKETRTLTIPITVPASAEPGGHYGVVRFTGVAAGGLNEVSLSASIGSLILLQVSGNIKQQARVEDFYASTTKYEKTSFFETSPITFVTRIKNEGNIHIKPTGTVAVRDMFGKEVAVLRMNGDPTDEKNKPGSILPQSVRRFDAALKDSATFGRYTATLSMSYGDDKTLQQETVFWVIPYKVILAGIGIVTVVVLGLIFGIKRYNAHIIKKATGHSHKK